MNMFTKKTLLIPVAALSASLLLIAPSYAGCGVCGDDAKAHKHEAGHAHGLAEHVEHAHGGKAYNKQEAVAADFLVDFSPMFKLEGTMTFDTPVGKARLDLKDGTTVVFDGKQAWVSPAEAEMPPGMARFHVLTWPYFMAAPFKLDDPGANIADPEQLPFTDGTQAASKLTFDAGTGDAPDDWYYLFPNEKNQLIGMSYIVTYLAPKDEAENEPHVILYSGFEKVDGVTFSTDWTFKGWNKTDGVHGPAGAKATLSNIRFIKPDADTFVKPEGAREDKLPG